MVFPSSVVVDSENTVDKDSTSVKTKIILNNFWKKGAKKLSRKRRKAKRKRERNYRERRQMASFGKGPFDYYWGNYFRCVKWVQNHHASYWKSRAQALEYENRMLRTLVEESTGSQNLCGTSEHSQTCTNRTNENYMENVAQWYANGGMECETEATQFDCDTDSTGNVNAEKGENTSVGKTADGEEFEFEVDDNMIEFFTQSMKHKLELQRERDRDSDSRSTNRNGSRKSRKKKVAKQVKQESKSIEDDESSYDACMMGLKRVLPTECFQQNETAEGMDLQDILQKKAEREEKEKQKHELFGKSTSKILGMETAVQLNFRQNCATKHPILWPIIPLNL